MIKEIYCSNEISKPYHYNVEMNNEILEWYEIIITTLNMIELNYEIHYYTGKISNLKVDIDPRVVYGSLDSFEIQIQNLGITLEFILSITQGVIEVSFFKGVRNRKSAYHKGPYPSYVRLSKMSKDGIENLAKLFIKHISEE